MKKIVILGSTGSIGENTIRVARALRPAFKIVGLATHRNHRRLLEQARQLGVKHVAVADAAGARRCACQAPRGVRVHAGTEGLEQLATLHEADVVVCAVVGTAGLRPVLAALRLGCDVALATKEVLVVAGHLVALACRKYGGRLLPIDSEQSAIFQCLAGAVENGNHKPDREGREARGIRRLILTASGGPFAFRKRVAFDRVTVAQALAHPNWNMGRKVSVDSATLMNKGLEMMEARWLFDVPIRKIDILVHPQSILHSMVEFVDGSVLAQLSVPDMRFAIQYALTYPERLDGGLPPLDLTRIKGLRFFCPDERRFPCLRLAREAAKAGGTMPAVLNGANEVAVRAFLEGRIAFSGIWEVVGKVMDRHRRAPSPDLDTVLAADRFSRDLAVEMCRAP
ncbi:MAG: 1-deoxy-D-xylulose-5-phosphate reductoisomerase [Verrucomicrobiota bacterium]|nr:1-deoxy-D-xylulose-5-phosphate reductoisomerase [Verrucomicrobiota bacterium]